jgi:glycosyltransferase involved in cell wall biosynthesis
MYQQIVVLGRDMAEVIRAKIRPAERDIFLIPNWADVDMVNPLERAENPFALEQGLIDKFVVQFSGNIGRTHNIELLLETARLLEHRDDVVFLFVGYGGKTGLIDNAKRSGSKNIMFAPRQPRERLGPMLATSDLTVISFVPGMRGLSVPSRMYNVMAAGAAVLAVADPASELALTVQEAGAGWVMPEANPTALAALLEKLAADPSRRETRARGACGRHAVTTSFTLPIVLDQYRRLFRG